MFRVIWSPEAMDDYLNNIEYLETRWTEREARRFIVITEWTLNIVSRSPETPKRSAWQRTMCEECPSFHR